LADAARQSPSWRVEYQDNLAIILIRK
jgi:hypothetical protein